MNILDYLCTCPNCGKSAVLKVDFDNPDKQQVDGSCRYCGIIISAEVKVGE